MYEFVQNHFLVYMINIVRVQTTDNHTVKQILGNIASENSFKLNTGQYNLPIQFCKPLEKFIVLLVFSCTVNFKYLLFFATMHYVVERPNRNLFRQKEGCKYSCSTLLIAKVQSFCST